MKTAAFFDIDGTLLRGFIIQSFPRYLLEKGLIDPIYSRRIDLTIAAYRKGNTTYREAAEGVSRHYVESIKGLDVNRVRDAAQGFMDKHLSHSIYPYTQAIIDIARRRFDFVIALSGSPEEPVQKLHRLGFHAEYGSVFETKDGIYTGKIKNNLILSEGKIEKILKITEELTLDLSKSAAFGDSDQDAPMLELVGQPIVLNPTPEMKLISTSHKWHTFIGEDLPKSLERLLAHTEK